MTQKHRNPSFYTFMMRDRLGQVKLQISLTVVQYFEYNKAKLIAYFGRRFIRSCTKYGVRNTCFTDVQKGRGE